MKPCEFCDFHLVVKKFSQEGLAGSGSWRRISAALRLAFVSPLGGSVPTNPSYYLQSIATCMSIVNAENRASLSILSNKLVKNLDY